MDFPKPVAPSYPPLLLATNTGEGELYQAYHPELLEGTVIVRNIEQLEGRRTKRIFITNNVPMNSNLVLAAHRVLFAGGTDSDARPIHLKLDFALVRSMQKEGMEP